MSMVDDYSHVEDDLVRCPQCGSTQIHAEKQGWRLSVGFIGSQRVYITCLRCGARFRPGLPGYKRGPGPQRLDGLEWRILIGIIIIIIILNALLH